MFFQVGLLVTVGLAAKNAILIVEFAKQAEDDHGLDTRDAAVEAARIRLRPILMTSFAFVLGVLPLVLATGPGAEMSRSLGAAVFFGMLGVTLFGLVFTPVFYVITRALAKRLPQGAKKKPPTSGGHGEGDFAGPSSITQPGPAPALGAPRQGDAA